MTAPAAELTAPVEPRLVAWSGLRPRPKGSLKHVGNGVLKEDNRHTAPTMAALVLLLNGQRARHPRHTEFPLACPVEVVLAFFYEAPKSAGPLDRPSTTYTGDIDKTTRLVLDALKKARVIVDDSLVVDLYTSAWYDHRAGTRITVGPARGNDGARLATGWPTPPRRRP